MGKVPSRLPAGARQGSLRRPQGRAPPEVARLAGASSSRLALPCGGCHIPARPLTRKYVGMADRYRTADGWSVEVVRLSMTPDHQDGTWIRVRYYDFYVADVRTCQSWRYPTPPAG